MTRELGSYNTSSTRTHVRFQFSTHDSSGANVAPSSAFEAADLRIYRANDGAAYSATQRSSANGITMTSPFDTLTGVHDVDIDLTDNTDAGFYAAGYRYSVVLAPDETIDSATITGVVLAEFEIGPPPANVTQFGGTAGTFASGIPEVKLTTASSQALIELCFTYNATADYATADAGSLVAQIADNAGGTALTAAAIADAVWDEAQSGHTTVGTFGKYLDTEVSGVGGGSAPTAAEVADAVWDEARAGHVAAGSFGEGVVVNSIATGAITAGAIAADAITAAKIADGAIDAATFAAGAINAAAIATDAIDADALAADATSEIATAVAAPSASSIATAVWGFVVENSKTATTVMRLMYAALCNKSALSGNTRTYRDDADTKDRITATTDTTGQRTAVTKDGT